MATDARDLADAPPLGGEVAVSPMRRRHLDAVLDIEQRTYPRPWPRMIFEAELERDGRRYVVARLGHRVVGYGGVLDQAGDVHLTTVAVDPELQGRGVAGRLVYELLLIARDMTGPDAGVTLEVRASNEPAQRLYRRFGFEVEGRRPGYYAGATPADPAEDALLLWLRDLHGDAVSDRLRACADRLGLHTSRRGGRAGTTPT